jgi:O-acetyl-ADP-ribose deacetylase (regulator of RNase III)
MAISNRLKLVVGDITRLHVDAIVNAANESLSGGGGVDGAIHRAAGPGLLEECLLIGHCPEGEAKITRGHALPAKFVIHTVGPVWEDGLHRESEVLARCYQSTLQLAEEHAIETLAFSCIATGVYGYPKAEAAEIAVNSALEWLKDHTLPSKVIFCCYDAENAELYRRRLGLAEQAATEI